MPDETEAVLECGMRMVTATDGTAIPVPSGSIGGVYTANGAEVWINDTADVKISLYGGGYYVVVNSAGPANDEARNLFEDLTAESLEHLAERIFVGAAPTVFKIGLSVAGLLASVLTTSNLTREIFIRGEYEGVPIQYCLLV
jgi:hypothetical protein